MFEYSLYACRGREGRCCRRDKHYHVSVKQIIQFHVSFSKKIEIDLVCKKLYLITAAQQIIHKLFDQLEKPKKKELKKTSSRRRRINRLQQLQELFSK